MIAPAHTPAQRNPYECPCVICEAQRANARIIAVHQDALSLAAAVDAHFPNTDAPLGKMAREFIRKATGES